MATEYVVLQEHVTGESPGVQTVTYHVVDRVTAASSQAAVRQVVAGHVNDDTQETFQAVPARSWDTGRHQVTVKNERKVTLG